MIQLITGQKGKGKTKHLLANANTNAKSSNGTIVFLDKSARHIYELNNSIRLINVCDYLVTDGNELVAFICGLAAANHDIEQIFIDSFLSLVNLDATRDCKKIESIINELNDLSSKLNITFYISISCDECYLNDSIKKYIVLSL